MADPTPKLYDGMFLLSQSAVGTDPQAGIDLIKNLLDRAGAEVVTLYKWEERKLAYTIEGQKRGTFYQTFFKVTPTAIATLERDCNLNEEVLRFAVLRGDHIGETELAASHEAQANSQVQAKLEAEPKEDAKPAGEPAAEPAAAE